MRVSVVPMVLWGVAGCGRIGFNEANLPDGGALATRTLLLHLDQTDVQEPLIDFPLLVELHPDLVDRRMLRGDALNLTFSLDGQPLAYEIEDPGDAQGSPVVAWVKVPRLAGSDTTIRLDYGGRDPAPAPVEPVWSASYAGVFHLAEPSGSPHDATGHFPDSGIIEFGTLSRPGPAAGQISRGRSFQSMQRNAIQVDATALMYSPFTVSGWLDETTLPTTGFQALVSREHFGAGDDVFWIGDLAGAYRAELMRAAGAVTIDTAVAAVAGRWVHLALTAGDTAASLFVDGQLIATQPISGLPAPGNEKPIILGADDNTGALQPTDDFLDGVLDEVRIETVARSAEWVRVDHLSMINRLIRYEDVTAAR